MAFFGEISAKEHNGLRLLVQLAKTTTTNQPLSLQAVAHDEGLSMKYLEQLVRPFRAVGWVRSARGRRGGYTLVKDPGSITLYDVIRVLDGEPTVVSCLTTRGVACPLVDRCPSQRGWQTIQRAIHQSLKSMTLADLIHPAV